MLDLFILVSIFFAFPAFSADETMLKLPLYARPAAIQGEGQCEIAAVFNFFHLGRPESHLAIDQLYGNSLEQKYLTFFSSYALKPTMDYPDHSLVRTTAREGTSPADMHQIAVEFIDSYTKNKKVSANLAIGQFIIRQNKIENFGEFGFRVYKSFFHSLQMGSPIVAILAGYKTENEKDGIRYTKLHRHAVTLVSISKDFLGDHFKVDYVDPDDGGVYSATIYESANHFSTFYREVGHLVNQKAIGLMPLSNVGTTPKYVNSPMLQVNAPDLWATEDGVTFTVLEYALGEFGEIDRNAKNNIFNSSN